jgi:hypothetical protein
MSVFGGKVQYRNPMHCPLCLEYINEDYYENVVGGVTRCPHKMHIECAAEYLEKTTTRPLVCPVCRVPLDEGDLVRAVDANAEDVAREVERRRIERQLAQSEADRAQAEQLMHDEPDRSEDINHYREHPDLVVCVAYSRSNTVASGSAEGLVFKEDTVDGTFLQTVQCQGQLTSMCFLGAALFTCTARCMQMWVGTELFHEFYGPGPCKMVATCDAHIAVVANETKVYRRIPGFDGYSPYATIEGRHRMAEFNPGGDLLAVATRDNCALVWDVQLRTTKFRLAHQASVHVVRFNHGGVFLATASEDGTACRWRASDGSLLQTISEDRAVIDARFAGGDNIITLTRNPPRRAEQQGRPPGRVKTTAPDGTQHVSPFLYTPRFIRTSQFDGMCAVAVADTVHIIDERGNERGHCAFDSVITCIEKSDFAAWVLIGFDDYTVAEWNYA